MTSDSEGLKHAQQFLLAVIACVGLYATPSLLKSDGKFDFWIGVTGLTVLGLYLILASFSHFGEDKEPTRRPQTRKTEEGWKASREP